MKVYTVREYLSYAFFSYAVAKMYKVALVKWKLVFEKLASAKILKVNVPNPEFRNTFITDFVSDSLALA